MSDYVPPAPWRRRLGTDCQIYTRKTDSSPFLALGDVFRAYTGAWYVRGEDIVSSIYAGNLENGIAIAEKTFPIRAEPAPVQDLSEERRQAYNLLVRQVCALVNSAIGTEHRNALDAVRGLLACMPSRTAKESEADAERAWARVKVLEERLAKIRDLA